MFSNVYGFAWIYFVSEGTFFINGGFPMLILCSVSFICCAILEDLSFPLRQLS